VFHSREDVVLPDEPDNSADDWALQMLADHAGNFVFDEFKATVNDLDPDQQQEVIALMWLGRGEYSTEEWNAAVQTARENWTENSAEYLIAHPMVADHLLEGLNMLGYSCEE
jgi:hypothetical protein